MHRSEPQPASNFADAVEPNENEFDAQRRADLRVQAEYAAEDLESSEQRVTQADIPGISAQHVVISLRLLHICLEQGIRQSTADASIGALEIGEYLRPKGYIYDRARADSHPEINVFVHRHLGRFHPLEASRLPATNHSMSAPLKLPHLTFRKVSSLSGSHNQTTISLHPCIWLIDLDIASRMQSLLLAASHTPGTESAPMSSLSFARAMFTYTFSRSLVFRPLRALAAAISCRLRAQFDHRSTGRVCRPSFGVFE